MDQTKKGDTPMLVACKQGNLEIMQWLHAAGAAGDTRAPNIYGCTPMYWACYNGHLNICRWLADEGGADDDVTSVNQHGITCMLAAAKNGESSQPASQIERQTDSPTFTRVQIGWNEGAQR